MGEIMRCRVTRPAQRRVPASESLLNLGAPSTPPVNDVIEALQKKDQPTIDAAISSYSNLLSSALALRRYLTTGNAGAAAPAPPNPGPGVIQILVDLLHLDQWLAATAPVPPARPPFTTPTIAALNQQIVNLIGEPLPAAWQTLS